MVQSLLKNNMAIRKNSEGKPQISGVAPAAAIAGGELQIRGKGFVKTNRPRVTLGEVEAPIVIGSDSYVIARVPDGAAIGELVITNGEHSSPVWACDIGIQIADSLHPVANPAVDAAGAIYATFSGSRGQKTPVSVYKVDLSYNAKPFLSDLMNATGLAFDREGMLYVSSRYDGVVYQVTPAGAMQVYVEGMGVATGMAFDQDENLYVGDRSGTIFKISRDRQIYVFATVEPSIAAYHLAFGAEGYLYVSGPTTSSFDSVYRIAPSGEVEVFFRGLGRPQGMAFDAEDRLYIAASIGGRRGIVRIDQERNAELFLSGPNIVGLAFTPAGALIAATNSSLYRVDLGIKGRPLP
jgi:sugar lactone lactonase YvrE